LQGLDSEYETIKMGGGLLDTVGGGNGFLGFDIVV